MNKFLVVIIKIGIDYERVRKRCFQCQKLTHDKASCPSFLLPVYDKDMDDAAVPVISAEKGKTIDSNNKSTQMVTPSSSKLLVDAFKSGKNYLHSLEIRGYNLESLPGPKEFNLEEHVKKQIQDKGKNVIISPRKSTKMVVPCELPQY
ncbi:unnamed protein product [Arabidopsis thaliana]|uniref:Zinc knuckle CX2CX4HX4C domain-containing protein n=1 Tax=Arabidopsis thaliana TaxID=3702 RepID=A0A654FC68_ARATH|nr:unnamed protein product [Arabidopsis thaliana]